MSHGDPRAAFWDEKILRWEDARYSALALANPFSWTVRRRMSLAARLLRETLKDCRRVLDLGCGSGLLARALLDAPERSYTGVDLSPVAVAAARRRYEAHAERVRFEVADAVAWPAVPADAAVFLGLVDWLTDAQLEELFARRREPRLLFSFTETGGLFSRVYGLYRGSVDRTQRARTLGEPRVRELLARAGYRPLALHREARLGPACLVVAAREDA